MDEAQWDAGQAGTCAPRCGQDIESRPNVTADSVAFCLKSGNVCMLRGGSEAIHSNRPIAAILSEASGKAGVPSGAIVLSTVRTVRSFRVAQDRIGSST